MRKSDCSIVIQRKILVATMGSKHEEAARAFKDRAFSFRMSVEIFEGEAQWQEQLLLDVANCLLGWLL